MDPARIDRLTDAQRACLRLVLKHYETKEIARELGITPTAVVERLRAARQVLGASRSIDAARVLANYEDPDNMRRVDMPTVVEAGFFSNRSAPSVGTGGGGRNDSHSSVKEDRAQYVADFPQRYSDDRDLSVRIPLIGSKRDDLRPWQIICCFIVVSALAIVAFGVFLKINLEVDTARQLQLREQHPP